MVWVVEKKIVRHSLDAGFERVEIPVRVKFEFEVQEGVLVPSTLSKDILYNQKALQKHYPNLKLPSLHVTIEKTVENEIIKYFRQCGISRDNPDDAT